MDVREARRLRALENENAQLKRIIADPRMRNSNLNAQVGKIGCRSDAALALGL